MEGNGSAARFQFGAVTLIPDERMVLKDGRALALTPKAFDLLAVLAANPGRLLTKDHLMQAVWPDTQVEEANLAYHVFAIRKAFGENSTESRYIETVPKSGYRFVAPVVRVEGDGAQSTGAPKSATSTPVGASPATLHPGVGLIAGVMLLVLIVIGLGQVRKPSVPITALQFQEPVIGRLAETGMFSISPDGGHFVYAAEGTDGVLRLQGRKMSSGQVLPLPGTEVFAIIPPVVWSPDSRFVAFDPGGVVKKVAVDGGEPQTICDFPSTAVGGSWNRDGVILLGNAFGGLIRCEASGGAATILTGPQLPDGERHIFPSFLADGQHFIYLRVSRSNPELSGIYTGSLTETDPAADQARLITTGFGAAYVRSLGSGPGLIVFARDGGLFAQRLDERRLQIIGDPVRLADGIGSYLDGAFFSVSATTLVYRAAEPQAQLTWFDREGREVKRIGTPNLFSGLALSPDSNRAVVTTQAPQGTTSQDLWLFDLSRTSSPVRMTFAPALELSPVWSAHDRFVFGSGGGSSGVYEQTIGGDRRLLFKSDGPEITTSASVDGRIVLYTTLTRAGTGADVWVRNTDSATAEARPVLQGPKHQSQAQLSPDSRWVAYVSNEAGPSDVFVAPFPADPKAGPVAAGNSIRISDGGGFAPRWRRDGRELLYLTPDGSVMAMAVDPRGEFRATPSTRLFKVPGVVPDWGLTRHGDRFLFAVPVSPSPRFTFVRDWQAGLPKQD